MKSNFCKATILFVLCFATFTNSTPAAADVPVKLSVKWDKVTRVSNTHPSLQVVVNPKLRRDSPIHKQAFQALKDLKADYVRFVAWYPYPRLGVAALEPPKDGKTTWDFSLIDPLAIDFLEATRSKSVVMNFSTIPQWMFDTGYKVYYPDNPNEEIWSYSHGEKLRDPSGKELADYYGRLIEWYTKGGFTDEFGARHDSGHRYKIDYWEVFNEPEFEHNMSPEDYAARYDAIVGAIQKVDPQMKFVGISLAYPAKQPKFFEYFLNPKNHKAGIPLDMISYHFYAQPTGDQPVDTHQFTMFEQADKFIDVVRYIESIRLRLSPQTKTAINEVGSILPDDINQGEKGKIYLTDAYWNLSGAMFAYLYVELAKQGIDVLNQSQLVGFPGQFPSVTMLDWETGKPNARYHVLKLLIDNFPPPVKMVETELKTPSVHAQAFSDEKGANKVLLINKRDRAFDIEIPGIVNGSVQIVDQTRAGIAINKVSQDKITLNGFGVAIVTLPNKN